MEKWLDIDGYEGHYKISNYGRVMSFKNKRPKVLSLRLNADGYIHYSLRINGKTKEYMAQRLVITHFAKELEAKETVNHIDGVKTNNFIENLEWANRSEQMKHAYKMGLKKQKKGFESLNSIMSVCEVEEIRRLYKPHCKEFGMRALSKKYGVSCSTIDRITRNVNYVNERVTTIESTQ